MGAATHAAQNPNLPRILNPYRATGFGITRGRIRSELSRGNWRRLCPGLVLTRPDEPTRRDLAEAGLLLAGNGAVVSGWDAARCYGIGSAEPPSSRVLVLTTHGTNRFVAGVRIRPTARTIERRIIAGPELSLAGLPIAGPARAVADTALDCPDLPSARAVVTAAVQRGICSASSLLTEYQSGPRNNSYFLRRAVVAALDGAHSVAEAEAVDALIDGRLPSFELNVPICDPTGQVHYIVDILWRSLRAALEIDSRAHHSSEPDRLATMARHNRLAAAGFVVVHWAPAVIRSDPAGFASQVRRWIVGRAAELGTTVPRGVGPIRPGARERPEPYVVSGF